MNVWLFLHGFTGAPSSWDAVREGVRSTIASHCPFIYGHGADWRNVKVDSFEAEVSRLAKLALGLPKPRYLCGYSMGARLALGLILRQRSAFAGAILIGVHPGLEDAGARQRRRTEDSARARTLREEGLDAFVRAWEASPLFGTQARLDDALLKRQRAVRLSHDAEGLARALERLGLGEMPGYGSQVAALALPVRLMAGALDGKFAAISRALAKELPNGRVEIVEAAGHNLPLEAPAAVSQSIESLEAHSR